MKLTISDRNVPIAINWDGDEGHYSKLHEFETHEGFFVEATISANCHGFISGDGTSTPHEFFARKCDIEISGIKVFEPECGEDTTIMFDTAPISDSIHSVLHIE
jgi:hypothetical protein